jgi:hypothetical protein
MNIRTEREAKKTQTHKRSGAAASAHMSWQDVVMVTFSRVRARQLQEQVNAAARMTAQ